jgi:hypothetical protein
MPLLRRFFHGEGFAFYDPLGALEQDCTNADEDEIYWTSNAVRVAMSIDIQLVLDLLTEGRQLAASGPLRPPYPATWLEWTKGNTPGGATTCGMLIHEHEDPAGGSLLEFFMLSARPDTEIMRCNTIGYVHLNSDGLMDSQIIKLSDGQRISLGEAMQQKSEMLKSFCGAISVCLVALGIINCKNVRTEETGQVTLARSGSEKRRGIPARKIKYHTIQLPGGGTRADGKGGHRATAIHRVRGHFKTFTAEKPLLGQHVGTYWWGWQVRGKAENGIVVSDYSLEGAKQ